MTFALAHLGCLAASTFTSARTIPRGTFEHVAALDVTTAVYDDDTKSSGLVESYAMRYGASDRVEVGGRISPFSLEASAKIAVVRGERFALAVAPRATSTSGLLLTLVRRHPGAVYGRIPILATFQITDWASLTPRAGIGYALGLGSSSTGTGDYGFATTRTHELHDPVLEGGGTLLFRIAPTVSFGVDGYAVSTFLDRQVLAAGGGVALLFTPRQETQR